jgi:hypothetical protein
VRTIDIAWVAGVLEGEASFGYYRGTPTIQVQMTDADVIARLTALFGSTPRAPWARKDGYKPVYTCIAHGITAVGWMQTVYTFMGERRRAKIREVLAAWKLSTRRPRAGKGERLMATCHPERVRSGRGLCQQCYMREWRAARRNAVGASLFTDQ